MTDPALEALWKKVVDAWDDDAPHGAFLEHSRRSGQLLEAAVRYRGMAGDHQRGAAAEKRLKSIQLLALAALEAERTPPREARVDWARVVLIVFFLSASAALLMALYSR